MKKLSDIRLRTTNGQIEVKPEGRDRWFNLLEFSKDSGYKFGYKDTSIKKPFNPYMFFCNSENERIQKFIDR